MSESAFAACSAIARAGSTSTVKGAITVAVKSFEQRAQHRGRNVCAASHRLCKDHFRAKGLQVLDRCHQLREPAAEASSRYLSREKALRRGKSGIHKIVALVVEDDGTAHPALLKQAGGGEDQCCFSGGKKAADNYDAWPWLRICRSSRTAILINLIAAIRPIDSSKGYDDSPFAPCHLILDRPFRRSQPKPSCPSQQSRRNGKQEFPPAP